MPDQQPLVSVVIPTYDRPELLRRAVRSALGQTCQELEILVVLDGASEDSYRALNDIADPRLRLVPLEQNVGAPAARTAGVSAARGHWIAPLDDDDEWMPSKIAEQLQAARDSRFSLPVVACRFLARTDEAEFLWPRRRPDPEEPLSEYLFCSSGLAFGEGVLPSTVLFAPRELFLLEPPRCSEARHDDLDWLLRVAGHPGVGIQFVASDEPLAIWHRENRPRPLLPPEWLPSVTWIRSHFARVTPRAYSSFVLRWTGSVAARYRKWDAFWPLLAEAIRHGRPLPRDVLVYLAYWLVPVRMQPALARWWAGRRGSRASTADRGAA